MLKSINRKFLVFGVIILLFFIPMLGNNYTAIYLVNFITLFAYYQTISTRLNMSDQYYTKERLGYIVFSYSIISLIVFKTLSFYYNQNFFVFSEADTVTYHEGAIQMNSKSFFEGINFILEEYQYDDLGAFVLISTLYRIIESNLFLSLFYIFVGIVTSFSIFRICKNFTSVKYSFLCSLTYSISSFVIWFHASGLKESFMVMLVILFYDYYYVFLQKRTKKYLFLSILFLLALLLFRPALVFFCICSIIISVLLTRKGRITKFLLLITTIVLVIFSYSYISSVADRYLLGSTELMLANKEADGMVIGSVQFTYQVNILAGAIGPLPSVLSSKKQALSMLSIGIMYRVFISTAFWFAFYYIIKDKVSQLYPLLLFFFMEVISLVFILEALELRKSLPHIPVIFIVSFWFLDFYDKKKIGTEKIRRRLKNIWSISSIVLLIIILYWNFR